MEPSATAREIEELLAGLRAGTQGAYERLMEVAYEQLRKVARQQLRRLRPGQTLNTTGLVHETYIKLASADVAVDNNAHFLAIIAAAMRQVVVDHVRKRYSAKRGGGEAAVPLDGSALAIEARPSWLLDLDAALVDLATLQPELVKVVECRFFGGMTEAETARALGMSLRTVQRSWQTARGWLKAELGGG